MVGQGGVHTRTSAHRPHNSSSLKEGPMPGEASSAASYATATDNLRTAARWLLTAAAAAGAVLVAGVQLTSIGSLGPSDWPRLIAAAVGLAAGLGAVGYMIFQASLLLTDEWITLA